MTTTRKPAQPAHNPAQNELPTTAQLAVLAAFARLSEQLGRAPSIAEVSREMGFAARLGAQKALERLEKKGLLEAEIVRVRGPRKLTREGRRWLKQHRG